jgi:hypothetical protein
MMVLRFVIGVWLCLGAGGISAALADPVTPPTSPAATSAPAPSTEPKQAAPAAAAPAADAKSATPAADTKPTVVVQGKAEEDARLEKYFLAEGYKLEMHNGEKLLCRREEKLGTRLGGHNSCGTAEQLSFIEEEAKAAVERGRMHQNNPVGK